MRKQLLFILISVGTGIALYLFSLSYFDIYQIISESTIMLIASMILIVSLLSRHYRQTDFFIKRFSFGMPGFIVLSFLHVISSEYFGIIAFGDTNISSQFWISAYFILALSLLHGVMLWKNKKNLWYLAVVQNVLAALFIVLILADAFPLSYLSGSGFTAFYKICSLVFIAFHLFTTFLLIEKKNNEFLRKYPGLIISIVMFIVSSVFLTFNIGTINFSIFLGNYLLIIGFIVLFLEFIYAGISDPLNRIFEELKNTKDTLEKSEEKFKSLFEDAPLGYQSLDINANFLDVNQKWVEILGYEKEEVLGKWFGDFLHSRSLPAFKDNFPKFVESGKTANQLEMTKKDGSIVVIKFDGHIVRDESGNFVRTHCILKDITEETRLAKALSETELKYSMIFNNSPIGICTTNTKGVITNVNSKFCEMLGYTEEEFKEISFIQITHPDDIEASKKVFGEILAGKTIQIHKKYIKKDGYLFHARTTASMIFDKDGSPIHSVTLIEDISKEIENKMMKDRANAVTDSELVGNVVTDYDGNILYVNEYFAKCHGYTTEDLREMNLKELYNSEMNDNGYNKIDEGKSTPYEMWHLKNDGTELPLLVNGKIISDNEGNPLYRIINAIDITEIKKLEARTSEMEDEVKYLQRMEALGTMAGGIAHEINNPINGIMNYGQLIIDNTDETSENHEYAGEIVSESMRVSGIVNNLLNYARHGICDLEIQDVSKIIEDTADMANILLKGDNIELNIEPSNHHMLVECQVTDIRQVLMNIISNSRDSLNEKYPGENKDKRILIKQDITLHEGNRFCRISIKDLGMGISPSIKDKVLDPFFTSKGREYFTGMGLSVCHRIINNHNGFLTFSSNPGKSTVFYVELPLHSLINGNE